MRDRGRDRDRNRERFRERERDRFTCLDGLADVGHELKPLR